MSEEQQLEKKEGGGGGGGGLQYSHLQGLMAKITALNVQIDQLRNQSTMYLREEYFTENHKKVILGCHDANLTKIDFKRTPPDYYSWPLLKRRLFLSAQSVHHLCKSLIVENTECPMNDCSDPGYSKYYCLIIQYTTSYNSQKLFKYVRGMKNPLLPKKMFHFRLADEAETAELTGFEHNAVTPFGMKTKMPIIISDRIVNLGRDAVIWLGGGEVNSKLAISVSEFVETCFPLVVDITNEGWLETDPLLS